MTDEQEQVATYKAPLTAFNQNVKVGIIGGTNIGKSSLYNCLTKMKREAIVENALFTTVDPSIAIFEPYDRRIEFFKKCFPSVSGIVQANMTVLDSAGIVTGAFKSVRTLVLTCSEVSIGVLTPYDNALIGIWDGSELVETVHTCRYAPPYGEML
jgi:hypothetical protein